MTLKRIIAPDDSAFTEQAVAIFIELANKAIAERGLFSVALSGGSTPEPVYRALAHPEIIEKVDWSHVQLFWGDERHVPPEHPNSNYRMVRETLLSSVPIPEESIHRVPAEMEVRMAAFSYEETLRQFFGDERSKFDLVLLGMGADGHTASLFPHSAGLNETFRWFIPNYAHSQDAWRLTLTKVAINAARTILVMVKGAAKADTLVEVLTGANEPDKYPIQLISPTDGEMIWLLDEGAASQLPAELLP